MKNIKYKLIYLLDMESEIQIFIMALIGTYLIFRFFGKKQKKTVNVFSGILNDDKYKVKGQWDKNQ